MIDDYLRSRTRRPIPEVYSGLLDLSGAITRPTSGGADQHLQFQCVYTAEASSECVWDEETPVLLIDLRFVDFTLELVRAFERAEQHQAPSVFFALFGFFLEQTLSVPESNIQRGAVIDYLVSRVTADVHLGMQKSIEEDPGQVEYVTKLVSGHEVAHAWFAIDRDYLVEVLTLFEAEVQHFVRIGQATDSGRLNPVYVAAESALRSIERYKSDGVVEVALEELLCDYVMIRSGAEAAVATRERRSRVFTYLTLALCTLHALWIVPTVQQAARSLSVSEGMSTVNLDPGELKSTRSVIALMVFLRIAGLSLDGDNTVNEEISSVWDETVDVEAVCVSTLNQLMGQENLQRFEIIGKTASALGLGFDAGVRPFILQMRGWSKA